MSNDSLVSTLSNLASSDQDNKAQLLVHEAIINVLIKKLLDSNDKKKIRSMVLNSVQSALDSNDSIQYKQMSKKVIDHLDLLIPSDKI